MIEDAVVPRSRLPQGPGDPCSIPSRFQLRLAKVFHAGDGNLHPLICFDSRFADEVRRVKDAGRELMEVCVAAGGAITGEHGVGLDKRELLPLVFSEADMNAMLSVRAAFDPLGLCNPGKIVPMLRGCGEAKAATPKEEFSPPLRLSDSFAPLREPHPTKSLAQIVGDANISSHNGTITVSPASAEEISETLKLASSEGWTEIGRAS